MKYIIYTPELNNWPIRGRKIRKLVDKLIKLSKNDITKSPQI